ncbi:MAG: SPOCS domain-containing protein [Candidatus Neoclostridium sp.]
MSFEPVYGSLKAEERGVICSTQAVIETRLSVPDGVTVKKVLSVSGECYAAATEVFSGEARFSGNCNVSVIYEDENGEKGALASEAEFSDRLTDERINGKIRPFLYASVIDVDATESTEKEICPSLVIEVTLVGSTEKQIDYLSACSDGIYTKQYKAEYLKQVDCTDKEISVPVTVEGTDYAKVFKCSASAVVRKVTALTDAALVEGDVMIRLIGVNADGMLIEKTQKTEFSEECDLADVRSGDVITCDAATFGVSHRSVDEGGTVTVEMNAVVKLCLCAFTRESASVISDTFCMQKQTVESLTDRNVCKNMDCVRFAENVSGNVTLDIGNPPAYSVLYFDAVKVNVTSSYIQSGRLTIEGILSGTIAYYAEDDKSDCSVNVELPFSVTENAQFEDDSSVFVTACVGNTSVRVRRANELGIKAEVCFTAAVCESKRCSFISALQEGEEVPKNDAAVSVHIAASGEELWDVAKKTGCAPERIMAENPGLELPLKGGERILVYRNIES